MRPQGSKTRQGCNRCTRGRRRLDAVSKRTSAAPDGRRVAPGARRKHNRRMRKAPIRSAVVVLTLLLSGTASAEYWRWTDDEGNVHYTDDATSIPEKHRKKANKTRGAERGALHSSDSDSGSNANEAKQAPATSGTGTHIELSESRAKADEGKWRGRFRSARQRIAELEQARAALKRIVEDPAGSGMPVVRDPNGIMRPNPEYERSKARLEETELELARAKEDLANLERLAANAAVPLEWRR